MKLYPYIDNGQYIIEPQELFQKDIEINGRLLLKDYKNSNPVIVIVGAWRGEEIISFLKWDNSSIYAFEPNNENFKYLHDVYGKNSRVKCFNLACGDKDGQAELFQANLTGNDSILPINERSGFTMVSSQIVSTIKLDSVEVLRDKEISLLWIDVQGFEKYVLLGAESILKRTEVVFLELNDNDNAYKGATRISEVVRLLESSDFYMAHKEVSVQLETGICSGLGLFLRKTNKTGFFDRENTVSRLKNILKIISKNKLRGSKLWYKLLINFLPKSVKKYLKKILIKNSIK